MIGLSSLPSAGGHNVVNMALNENANSSTNTLLHSCVLQCWFLEYFKPYTIDIQHQIQRKT